MVFNTVVLTGDTMNQETNNIIARRTENLLKIPTGWRLTSWLFARRSVVEFAEDRRTQIQLAAGRRIWSRDFRIIKPAP